MVYIFEELEDEINRQRMKVEGLEDIFKNPIYRAYSELDELQMYRAIVNERRKLDTLLSRW